MQIMEPIFCFIRESYFIKNSNFIKMLDCGDTKKQSRRTHLCIKIEKDGNNFYIPLRNSLGSDIRKFGRIGHSVPWELFMCSDTKAMAEYHETVVVRKRWYALK